MRELPPTSLACSRVLAWNYCLPDFRRQSNYPRECLSLDQQPETPSSSSPRFSSRGNPCSSPRTMAEQIERNSSCFFRLTWLAIVLARQIERATQISRRSLPSHWNGNRCEGRRQRATFLNRLNRKPRWENGTRQPSRKQTRRPVLVLLRDGNRFFFFFLQKQKS